MTTHISEIDHALTAQLAVAWAGEAGEENPRLGWWRSDLLSEFGGEALFESILPATWRWAALQAAREAARRKDAELRQTTNDPDQIHSLFRLGFTVDERLDDRLQELKRSGQQPREVFPTLYALLDAPWSRDAFAAWIARHGEPSATAAPVGRRLTGDEPADLIKRVDALVAGFAPLSAQYPLPHFRGDA